MLRYFYIIVCIQMCFCSVYIDNNDYEMLDRRVRCKTTRAHSKPTRSPRKSRVVQFDVQKFMRGSDSQTEETEQKNIVYADKTKKRPNRLVTEDDAGFVEPHESGKGKIDDAGYNTRSNTDKYPNQRHFNFHSHVFDDKEDKMAHENKKAMASFKNGLGEGKIADPEKKCSFKKMKIPFFSRNKATTKSKRHKKRRIFCFNCGKKTTTRAPQLGFTADTTNVKTEDFTPSLPTIPATEDKTNTGVKISKIQKRAYDQLCPKCIKELLTNLRKKTTKKIATKNSSRKLEHKLTTNKKTLKQKADLSDSFQESYDVGNERLKRNENEEMEKRLRELDEVEKKIENVQDVTYTSANG